MQLTDEGLLLESKMSIMMAEVVWIHARMSRKQAEEENDDFGKAGAISSRERGDNCESFIRGHERTEK